jgi:hypothetical protein
LRGGALFLTHAQRARVPRERAARRLVAVHARAAWQQVWRAAPLQPAGPHAWTRTEAHVCG